MPLATLPATGESIRVTSGPFRGTFGSLAGIHGALAVVLLHRAGFPFPTAQSVPLSAVSRHHRSRQQNPDLSNCEEAPF